MSDKLRPQFEALRLVSAKVDNSGVRANKVPWQFEVSKEIEVGVAYPNIEGIPILGVLKIRIIANGTQHDAEDVKASLEASYEAVFKFDASVSAPEVAQAMEKDDDLQYLLSVQAATLAGTSFRALVHTCGFDPKLVPLGM